MHVTKNVAGRLTDEKVPSVRKEGGPLCMRAHVVHTHYLVAQLVAEMVDGQWGAHRQSVGDLAWDQFVEPIRDGHVLDDVYMMQNVTSRRGHRDRHTLGGLVIGCGPELHASAKLANGRRVKIHADDGGHFADRAGGSAGGEARAGFLGNEGLLSARGVLWIERLHACCALLVHHIDRFHGERSRAVPEQ